MARVSTRPLRASNVKSPGTLDPWAPLPPRVSNVNIPESAAADARPVRVSEVKTGDSAEDTALTVRVSNVNTGESPTTVAAETLETDAHRTIKTQTSFFRTATPSFELRQLSAAFPLTVV
jgi:hypothetical protein